MFAGVKILLFRSSHVVGEYRIFDRQIHILQKHGSACTVGVEIVDRHILQCQIKGTGA